MSIQINPNSQSNDTNIVNNNNNEAVVNPNSVTKERPPQLDQLEHLEKTIRDAPVVDQEKVDYFKQQIESGNYKPNLERTIDRMISLEQMIYAAKGERHDDE